MNSNKLIIRKRFNLYLIRETDRKPLEIGYAEFREKSHFLARANFETKEEAEKYIEEHGETYEEYAIVETYYKIHE